MCANLEHIYTLPASTLSRIVYDHQNSCAGPTKTSLPHASQPAHCIVFTPANRATTLRCPQHSWERQPPGVPGGSRKKSLS